MESKLLVTSGKTSKQWVALRLPTVLGRGRGAGLTVRHPLISRRHCELFEQDGLLMLRDLGSLNGTMIQGRRVALAPLPPGAEFTIGPLTFQAQYEYGGDLANVPPAQFLDAPGTREVVGDEAAAADEELPESLAVEGPPVPARPDIADSQPEIPVLPMYLADAEEGIDFVEPLENPEVVAVPGKKQPDQGSGATVARAQPESGVESIMPVVVIPEEEQPSAERAPAGRAKAPQPSQAAEAPEVPVDPRPAAKKKEAWRSPTEGSPGKDLPGEDEQFDSFLDGLQ
ncbi:MAG: FHA domain-containing protein [Thermoguttaceae bacterium]|jgi:predicted component of type VI protein secretion system